MHGHRLLDLAFVQFICGSMHINRIRHLMCPNRTTCLSYIMQFDMRISLHCICQKHKVFQLGFKAMLDGVSHTVQ